MNQISNDEWHYSDGRSSGTHSDKCDSYLDYVVGESNGSNRACYVIDTKDAKGKSIGFVSLINDESTKVFREENSLQDEDSQIAKDNTKKHTSTHSTTP